MKNLTIKLKTDLSVRYLRDYLFKFFRETNFNKNYIFIITKVHIDDENIIRTLGYKTLVDIKNKNDVTNYVDAVTKYYLDHKERYHPKANDLVVFYYFETSKGIYSKYQRNVSLNRNFDTEISKGIESPYNIPFNTLYNSWGDLKIINYSLSTITNINFNEDIDRIDVIKQGFDQSFVKVIFKNKKIINFIDTHTRKELDNIKRVFSENDLVVYFDQNIPFFSFDSKTYAPKFKVDKNGNITTKRVDVINSLLPAEKMNNNFITFDLETFDDNSIFQLLSISFAHFNSEDGRSIKTYSFYQGDYSTDKDLLDSAFNELFTAKFNKHFVYIHNGAKFDLVFLVKYLLNRDDILLEPIYKDGQFISIVIRYGKTKDKKGNIKFQYVLGIRDSFLLLPSSLDKLGKAFGVDTPKDIFPYGFPNKNNLNYVGSVPEYKFFDSKKVSLADYNDYVKRFKGKDWNLKVETMNYCNIDCISLLQIIYNFNILIFDKFQVDVLECPTLPSLAYKIFRTNYLRNNVLPIIGKKLYDDLVKA